MDDLFLPPEIEVLRADNPGPMTLDGTNTYVLHTLVGNVVIDPGPHLPDHLAAVVATGSVTCALVTHRHLDHCGGAAMFHELTGSPVRAFDESWCIAGEPLVDGELLKFGDVSVRVLATPGHTSDSICLAMQQRSERVLFTGDSVLGRGTSIVAHPDGTLGDYMASLNRLRDLTAKGSWLMLPGHGPAQADAHLIVEQYIDHRLERLEQVRSALAAGATTPREVVELVYADVDRKLWSAAEATVRAQLEYLGR